MEHFFLFITMFYALALSTCSFSAIPLTKTFLLPISDPERVNEIVTQGKIFDVLAPDRRQI
jgi:hypothetical protein